MFKRYLAGALFFSAAASLAIAVCPLADPGTTSAGTTTTSGTTSASTNSPEQSKTCYLVSHNKKKAVCVPANESASHHSYGDSVGATCPCPRS
jgi:hypothetical protein